eukprot:4000587-Karenia_brevis.AAC.1
MNVDSSGINTEHDNANSNGDDEERDEANDRTPPAGPEAPQPKNARVRTAGPYCLKCTYLGRTPIKEA